MMLLKRNHLQGKKILHAGIRIAHWAGIRLTTLPTCASMAESYSTRNHPQNGKPLSGSSDARAGVSNVVGNAAAH